jgi:peptide/nickel transport system permease protein
MRVLLFVLKRLAWFVPTLICVVIITFVISHLIPADPARLAAGDTATPEQVVALRRQLGFDRPLIVQLALYFQRLFTGDLGVSLYTGRQVAFDLFGRMPATIELTMVAMFITIMAGIPLGVLAAIKRNTVLDHIVRIFTVSGLAIASFWLGIMLQLLIVMKLGWLPLGGRIDGFPPKDITGLYLVDSLLTLDYSAFSSAFLHVLLPAATLAFPTLATVVRFTRAGVLEVIKSDFVLHERAMGLPPSVIVWKYVLRNALIATVTQIGLLFGVLLSGTVVVEALFDWPGIGYYAVNSIVLSDYNAILAFTVWTASIFILLNIIVDIILMMIDPRGAHQ